jgi:hypothetical protein
MYTIPFIALFFLGWGRTGHTIINRGGTFLLASSGILGSVQTQTIVNQANAADIRGSDPHEPNHYMDMDALPDFQTHSITHNLADLMRAYGESYVRNSIGFLPWVIDSTMTALTEQMRQRNWGVVWNTAADLGHYVADAYQPLHATMHYNGYSALYGSGSSGIHSRYESSLITSYQSFIIIDTAIIQYRTNILDEAFSIMYQSNSYIDSIYNADAAARQSSGYSGSGTAPASYYSALWQKVGLITQNQFQQAAVTFSSYIYTAWINAGSPLTSVTENVPQLKEFRLFQNYPNPFNPTTVISYELPVPCRVSLSVYDVLGSKIIQLNNINQDAGYHQTTFDAHRYHLSSGIYFYELYIEDSKSNSFMRMTQKLVLLK